jgi:hypothetical protein
VNIQHIVDGLLEIVDGPLVELVVLDTVGVLVDGQDVAKGSEQRLTMMDIRFRRLTS